MTKRQFYEELKTNSDAGFDDLLNFMSDYDIYSYEFDLKDDYAIDDMIKDEVREWDWYDDWRDLSIYLNNCKEDYTGHDYYLFIDGDFCRGIDMSFQEDFNYVIQKLESYLEYREPDWFDDDPDEETTEFEDPCLDITLLI